MRLTYPCNIYTDLEPGEPDIGPSSSGEIHEDSQVYLEGEYSIQRELLKQTDTAFAQRSSELISYFERELQCAVGVWTALRLAIRGYLCLDSIDDHDEHKRENEISMCVVCKAATKPLLLCSRCKLVAYCSKKHQKQHWGDHKVRFLLFIFIQ